MTDFSIIIPARFASSRLPGKPLMDLGGKTMIERVYDCALQSEATQVIVATDDRRIADHVASFGGKAVMTREDHVSGTDRLQEVVTVLGLAEDAIVVNVQGDEPLIPPEVIKQVADNVAKNTWASAATLCEKIDDRIHAFDPNIVKVVADKSCRALYFSRAPIPWSRDAWQNESFSSEHHALSSPIRHMNRHIGIYAYRTKLLHQFVSWSNSVLEHIEKLEQLRILENACQIHVEEACLPVPGGIDTPEDIARVAPLFGGKSFSGGSKP